MFHKYESNKKYMTKEQIFGKFLAQVSPIITERKKAYNSRKSVLSIAQCIFDKYYGTKTPIVEIKELHGAGEYFVGILEFVK